MGLIELKKGENCMSQAINEDDEYNHDLVKDCLDNLKSALFLLRKVNDIES